MDRRWKALAALLLIAPTLTGCRLCRGDRPGLLARLRGQSATPNYEPYPTPTFQPCCDGAGGPGMMYGGPVGSPLPIVTDPGSMPGGVPPLMQPGPATPGQAQPMPADPSKGTEMSRTKSKANPF